MLLLDPKVNQVYQVVTVRKYKEKKSFDLMYIYFSLMKTGMPGLPGEKG
jgi:hypothetical protein